MSNCHDYVVDGCDYEEVGRELSVLKIAILDLLEHPDPGPDGLWNVQDDWRKAYMAHEAAMARLHEVLMIP